MTARLLTLAAVGHPGSTYHRPAFDPGDQCEGGCGYAPEHCHCPADDQPTLLEELG